MDQTNSVMDFSTFARTVLKRQPGLIPGRDIPMDIYEQDKKAYEYYVKKGIDQIMTVQQPVEKPPYLTWTNEHGFTVSGFLKPDGSVQVVPTERVSTPGGTYTMQTPTNAVSIAAPNTPTIGNYLTGDHSMGGAPAPGIGGQGMAVTNAPTMTNAPSPSPTPYPEGAKIRSKRDGMMYQIVNGVPQLIPGQ